MGFTCWIVTLCLFFSFHVGVSTHVGPVGLSGCQQQNHELWIGRMYMTGGNSETSGKALVTMHEIGCCLVETTHARFPVSRTYHQWICPPTVDVSAQAMGEQERLMVAERTTLNDRDPHAEGEAWHTDRVDSRIRLRLDGRYTPAQDTRLQGNRTLHIFVIDTGIFPEHSTFATTNIEMLYPDASGARDCDGHGTHVASTAASDVGVIRGSNLANTVLYSVRVLDCQGSGTLFSVAAGMTAASNRIADLKETEIHEDDVFVLSMSLGGSSSSLIDDLVNTIVASQKVSIVASAGNSADDACTRSPAGAALAVTVGASTRDDTIADFSNRGSCVDIFAPGASVEAAIGSGSGLGEKSGTSMSAPMVSAGHYFVAGRDNACKDGNGEGPEVLVGSVELPNIVRCLMAQTSRNVLGDTAVNNRLLYVGESEPRSHAPLTTVSSTLIVTLVLYILVIN